MNCTQIISKFINNRRYNELSEQDIVPFEWFKFISWFRSSKMWRPNINNKSVTEYSCFRYGWVNWMCLLDPTCGARSNSGCKHTVLVNRKSTRIGLNILETKQRLTSDDGLIDFFTKYLPIMHSSRGVLDHAKSGFYSFYLDQKAAIVILTMKRHSIWIYFEYIKKN